MTIPIDKAQDIKELLDPVIQIAYQAGQKIMDIYDRDYSIEEKSDNTPLTEADLAAHDVIEKGLHALTPEFPILSEESKPLSFEERSLWTRYWLVDPLDGTREFIKRNGEFTVNIALVEDNEAVMGFIYAPVVGVLYYAAKGLGAYKRDGLEEPVAIHVRDKCPDTVVIAGGHLHATEDFQKFIEKLPDYKIIKMGSALKSCLVAEGSADIYARLGPTSEWDTAAAQCIVSEAGGRITKTDMTTLQYNTKENLLNPHFFVFGDTSIDWSQYL